MNQDALTFRAAAAADQAQAAAANRITVRVLTGSEKLEFLRDPELAQALLADNIVLDVQKAGSREIATRPDLKTFDAAYPAGAAAARKIAAATGSRRVFNSYYTPMTVASWKPLLPTLEANGIVGKKGNAYFIVDMRKLVALMEQGTRWKDLQPNPNYSVSKSVLI
ncbi:hypothetical protein AB4084_18760, partial [Lysobacter sp. 2RAB21]